MVELRTEADLDALRSRLRAEGQEQLLAQLDMVVELAKARTDQRPNLVDEEQKDSRGGD